MRHTLIAAGAMASILAIGTTADASSPERHEAPEAEHVDGSFGGVFDRLCAEALRGDDGIPGERGSDDRAGAKLTKTVVRTDRADGSADFVVTLTGALPAAATTASASDCSWIDVNGNGRLDRREQVRADLIASVPITGTGDHRAITFRVSVPGAAGRNVCDLAFGVASAPGRTRSFVSQQVCTPSGPPAQVPEAPFVPLLGLTALATGGGALLVRRRRAIRAIQP